MSSRDGAIMETMTSSEVVQSKDRRQYHIDLAPNELAEYILLCGDPARAERTSKHFSKVLVSRKNREYVTFTGIYEGIPVSVMSTGIGCGSTEIAVIESCQITGHPTFIRIGSSGALQADINVGELVVSTGAVRLEDVSTNFVFEGYPAIAHYEVVLALIEAAERLKKKYHVGITATGSGFYGAQGREVPGFPVRTKDLPNELHRMGVSNFEMESSTLFSLASLHGARAGTVAAIYANRQKGVFIPPELKVKAEGDCIEVGLHAIKVIAEMDRAKSPKRRDYWYPSLGLERTSASRKKMKS